MAFLLFGFSADKPIQFHGFGILGRVDSLYIQNPENFLIQLRDTETNTVILSDIVMVHHDGTKKVYELIFNNPKRLEANKAYTISINRQEYREFLNYVYDDADIEQKIKVDGVIFNLESFYGYNIITSLLFIN